MKVSKHPSETDGIGHCCPQVQKEDSAIKYLQKDLGLSGPPLTFPPKSPLLKRLWLEQKWSQLGAAKS